MKTKEYNKASIKILKFYEKHQWEKNFDYDKVTEYCKNELKLSEDEYLTILMELYEEGLITKLFSVTYGAQGDMVINIAVEPSRMTKLGRMALEDDKIYNKILRGSKSILEIISEFK